MRPRELDERIIAKDGDVFVATDTTYFPPIVINRIVGKTTHAVVEEYVQRHKLFASYAASQRRKMIIINDFSEAVTPDATVRKAFAAGAETLSGNGSPLICFVPILTSALFRGVMTAVGWMVRDDSNVAILYAKDFPDAIRTAKRRLEEHDEPVPDIDPDSYTFPDAKPPA
jgi:hypothetical protein